MTLRSRLVRGRLRALVYRLSALYWRGRTLGRVSGDQFRIVHPERIVVSSGGRIVMGRDSVIDTGARLIVHGTLRVGDGVYIGRDAVISMVDSVAIGAGTRVAERVSIHERNYSAAGTWTQQTIRSAPVAIGQHCWVGANVVLTAGATVGDRVTVGAQAVVTGHLPSGSTAVGVPARVIKQL